MRLLIQANLSAENQREDGEVSASSLVLILGGEADLRNPAGDGA